MALQSDETMVVSKLELIAQLDSARWQLSRDAREFGDDLSNKLSVKGQLTRSFRSRPSAWGLGLLGLVFFTTRLIFRKKELPKVEKTTYSRSRSTLVQMAKGQLLKRLLLAFEPLLTSVVKDRIPSASKPPSSHV
jgi:hypothetical protein